MSSLCEAPQYCGANDVTPARDKTSSQRSRSTAGLVRFRSLSRKAGTTKEMNNHGRNLTKQTQLGRY